VAIKRRFRFVAVAPSHPAKAQVTLASIRARTSEESPTGNHSSGKKQLLGILIGGNIGNNILIKYIIIYNIILIPIDL